MRKNNDRKVAEQTYLSDRGRITNKELAKKLQVHPATVARWKKLDEWDLKLLQSVTDQDQARQPQEEYLYELDLRQISTLNERIDSYLQKKELLPSEILDLAEAKYHLMSCMGIINDQLRYPMGEGFDDSEQDFD